MTWLLLWLKKIPLQVWFLIGGVLLILGFGYWSYKRGQHDIQAKWDAAIERGKVLVEDLKKKQTSVTEKIVTVTVEKEKIVYEKGKTITKLIPQYIPVGSCDLPGGFRLLHDAAATNTLPEAPRGVEAFPVPVATATETITGNYTFCHAELTKYHGLWQWVQEQQQLYLELCKQQGVDCSKGS
jgi:hypothetical protein